MVDPIRLGLPEPITYHLVNQLRHQEIRGVETGDRCEFDYVDRMDPMFPEEAPKHLQYQIPSKSPGLRCTCRGYERGIEDIDVEGQVDILAEEGEDLIDPRLIRVNVIGEEERSEEHTSELQSRGQLVCRLLLEKKKLVTPRVELSTGKSLN